MAAVKTAVDGLGDLDAVAPFLVRLGARHVRYGVRPEHFDVVGAALLWTLEQGLGELFTADVRDAWAAAWDLIAAAMGEGMRRAAAELQPADADRASARSRSVDLRGSRHHHLGHEVVRPPPGGLERVVP